MFITVLLTINKIGKNLCPSTGEWMQKTWYAHTMEYYSVVKNNEIFPFVATWTNLEGIMLSEIWSEIWKMEKGKYSMISLM